MPGTLWRWRFGPVGDPAQQAEDAFAGLVATAQDHDKQGKGDAQRNDDVGHGQDLPEHGMQVTSHALAAKDTRADAGPSAQAAAVCPAAGCRSGRC